ncbi:MAG TPA: metal ABC transporter ATP-binding protein [Gaiellaceae bacterium]|nr:metal ABC transporter ATP-binding protein [Gaiellaceae bacterium]
MAAIELENASVSRGGRSVWARATLAVEPGEFVAVLGPNGAGKSTLLEALLGLLPLTSGRAVVHGEVGYLPQRHAFDSSTRVRGIDLVRLGVDGARFGVPLPWRNPYAARIAEAIRVVGAESFAKRAIGELSGGEQQRLLIAQALVGEPDLLFLDEPLDSLDLPNQLAVAALLDRIRGERSLTVLLVAHDVNPLLPHLDRVIYVAGGRVLSGRPEDVITTETLTELYQAPVEVLRTAGGRLVVVGQPDVHTHHGHAH